MKPPKTNRDKTKTKFTTRKETPIALSSSGTVSVRTTEWEGEDGSGVYIQVRKVQLKGKGAPPVFDNVTLGGDPAIINAVADALKVHAKELSAKA